MADIDIVRKERSYTWLWVLLALVVLGLLWWALASGDRTDTVGEPVGQLTPLQQQLAPAAASLDTLAA